MPIYTPGKIILNKYRIEKQLGQGAFGEVYLATHLKLGPRALKVLRRDLPGVGSTVFHEYQARFELEARLGDHINHPNVIQVKDFDQAGNELVLAMEYAPGGSLLDWLEPARASGKPMEITRAIRMALDLGRGLSALHARDIVHRDLKPSNILFGADGSAKIGDLGVAQTPGGMTQRTSVDIQTPHHPGTPDYMSPEQVATFGYLTPASDMYSVGVVLFLALTLRNPKNLKPGTRLRALRPDAPEWLDALLAEMLEDDPKKRLFDGPELVRRMEEVPPLAQLEATRVEPVQQAAPPLPARTVIEPPSIPPAPQVEQPARQVQTEFRPPIALESQATVANLPAAGAPPGDVTVPVQPPYQPVPPGIATSPDRPPAPRLGLSSTVAVPPAPPTFGAQGYAEKPGRRMRSVLSWLIPLGVVGAALVALLAWHPWQPAAIPAPAATASQSLPSLAPTAAPAATLIRPPTLNPTNTLIPSPVVKTADTIVLALQQEPDNLHPGISGMMVSKIAQAPIFVGCMSQDQNTQWIPLGCESIPTIENGGATWAGSGNDRHLEVTYRIRKGWRWTDGRPVTGADVLAWWKLNMDPGFEAASRWQIEKIYDFKIVDANTVVAIWMSNNQAKQAEAGTLKGNVPFASFKAEYIDNAFSSSNQPVFDSQYWTNIGWWPAHIVSQTPARDQGKSDFARKPLGDGPYVVKDWISGQELVLEKSNVPFPLGEPKTRNIVFRFYSDSKVLLMALQAGAVDAVTNVSGLTWNNATDLDNLGTTGVYKVWYYPEYSWEHIDLNTQKFPLDDVKVRQALYYAIDKQALINTLYNGKYAQAELPGGLLSGNSQYYTSDYTRYPFDKAKASALLKEAGWDCASNPCSKTVNGVRKSLSISVITTDRADRQKLAQLIQGMWKAINVGVNVQFIPGRGLFEPCSKSGPLACHNYDAAIYTWVGSDDPGFWGMYNCAGVPTQANNWTGQNYPGWCNKDADKALLDAENNADIIVSPSRRKTAYAPFFRAWTAEVPVIPLFVNSVPVVARTGFKNYTCGPTNRAPCGWNSWEWELNK